MCGHVSPSHMRVPMERVHIHATEFPEVAARFIPFADLQNAAPQHGGGRRNDYNYGGNRDQRHQSGGREYTTNYHAVTGNNSSLHVAQRPVAAPELAPASAQF